MTAPEMLADSEEDEALTYASEGATSADSAQDIDERQQITLNPNNDVRLKQSVATKTTKKPISRFLEQVPKQVSFALGDETVTVIAYMLPGFDIEDFICLACTGLMDDTRNNQPIYTCKRGKHTVCQSCEERPEVENCPSCREQRWNTAKSNLGQEDEPEFLEKRAEDKRRLNKKLMPLIQVECPRPKCTSTKVTLDTLRQHYLQKCDYLELACEFCEERIPQIDMPSHLNEFCLNRPVTVTPAKIIGLLEHLSLKFDEKTLATLIHQMAKGKAELSANSTIEKKCWVYGCTESDGSKHRQTHRNDAHTTEHKGHHCFPISDPELLPYIAREEQERFYLLIFRSASGSTALNETHCSQKLNEDIEEYRPDIPEQNLRVDTHYTGCRGYTSASEEMELTLRNSNRFRPLVAPCKYLKITTFCPVDEKSHGPKAIEYDEIISKIQKSDSGCFILVAEDIPQHLKRWS